MKKSSATSSQSSGPEEKRLSEYLQYSLFEDPSPYTSKRVTITKDKHTISVSNPALQKVIWDLVERDSAAAVDREHNHILANIVAYKKDNPALPKVIELRIPEEILETQQVMNDGRPNYKAEVKEAIFEVEKEVILRALVGRFGQLSQQSADSLHRYRGLDHENTRLIEIKSDITGSRGFYGAKNVMIDPRTLIATKSAQDGSTKEIKESVEDLKKFGINEGQFSDDRALKDKLIEVINTRIEDINGSLDKLKSDNPEYTRWINGGKEMLDKQLGFLSLAVASGIRSLPEEKQRSLLMPEFGIDEAAIAKADPNLLDNAIREARGHSEDYLHFLIKNNRSFMEDIQKQLPEGTNRIYLVITSTLDACKRCAWKVEEMVDLINETLFSDERGEEKKVCKALYFATKQMKDSSKSGSSSVSEYSDGDNPISGDNLSDSSKKVIHAKPSTTTIRREHMTFASANLKANSSEQNLPTAKQ